MQPPATAASPPSQLSPEGEQWKVRTTKWDSWQCGAGARVAMSEGMAEGVVDGLVVYLDTLDCW